MSNIMEAALSHASKGYHVFPCKPNSKRPATPNGFKDATTDKATIREWWSENPEYNVAIRTGPESGIWVLDVDGSEGHESLRQFEQDIPEDVQVVHTPNNGSHLYFAYDGRAERLSNTVKSIPGLDVRANGGYVVAVGSVLDAGEYGYRTDRRTPAAAPQSLVSALVEASKSAPGSKSVEATIEEGSRNSTLFIRARSLFAQGYSDNEVCALLETLNAARCKTPVESSELVRIVSSASSYGRGELRTSRGNTVSVGVMMSDVQAEKVEWLWDSRIPLGKLTVLDGDPGLGKSVITMDLAARVTTGQAFPAGAVGSVEDFEHLGDVDHLGLGGVVILSAEDGLADTIRPRLDAAGADTGRIVAISTVPDSEGNERTIAIPEDIGSIERGIQRVHAKLVIVDPLMAFLSGKANHDQDVRKALTPLAKMAERTGAAVLVVRHLNKREGGKAIYRGGSSIGIIGAARSGLVVEEHPTNRDLRVLAVSKSNLAEKSASLTYSVAAAHNGAAQVHWGEATTFDANDILNPSDLPSRLEEAEGWLRVKLGDGPKLADVLKADAQKEGISETTLQRAKKGIAVSKKDGPDGQWRWYLKGGQGSQGGQAREEDSSEDCDCGGSGCLGCLSQELPFDTA